MKIIRLKLNLNKMYLLKYLNKLLEYFEYHNIVEI